MELIIKHKTKHVDVKKKKQTRSPQRVTLMDMYIAYTWEIV